MTIVSTNVTSIIVAHSWPGKNLFTQAPCRGWGWGGGGGGGAKAPPLLFRMVNFFFFGYPDLSLAAQTRFSNLTILNTHKQRTDKFCLVAIPNEFVALTV